MKILIVSQYFYPEVGAASKRVTNFARHLSKNHEVIVLTGNPTYPSGRLYEGFSNKFYSREILGKVRLVRSLVFPTKNVNLFKRFLNYSVFSASAFFSGLVQEPPDITFASTPPLFAAFTGLLLAKLKGVKLVLDVRDIWPGAAQSAGVVKSRMVLGPLRQIEKTLYHSAQIIITANDGVRQLLLKENPDIREEKVVTINNGVDLKNLQHARSSPKYDKYFPKDFFNLLYVGTIGIHQGLDSLVEAAKFLRGEKINLIVAGEGVEREKFEDRLKKEKLDNIKFLGLVSAEDVAYLVSKSSAGLVLLRNHYYNDYTLPTKIFDFLAQGKPIIGSGGASVKKLIEGERIGLWAEGENPEKLAGVILELAKNDKELQKFKGNGPKIVNAQFNSDVENAKLEKLIRKVVEGENSN